MSNDVLLVPITVEQPNVEAQSDVVVYVPQAHKNKAGIVKEGNGINIENGVVSLDRQTVEDMIDANKGVSYGFQQNLTEDEKGMARHNIGAGDNDFTGSYYDVTQKPHLNTDNSVSLPIGDEEINNTVQLHKISKTGSFNDLNAVPHETLDFAESERQKSKNLFNINGQRFVQGGHTSVSGNTITVEAGGSSEDDATFGLIPVEENKTYYIGAYSNNQRIQFRLYDTNKNIVNRNPSGWVYNQYWEGSYKDFDTTDIITEMTIPSGVAYIAFFTAWFGGQSIISNLIISEYADVEDYQPYNGAIVHEKELNKRNITLLWENTRANVYEDFNPQTITLPNSDYDCLIVLWNGVSQDPRLMSTVIYKGKGAFLNWAYEGSHTYSRELNYTNDTTLTCMDAKIDASTVSNVYCVPYKILGFKLN